MDEDGETDVQKNKDDTNHPILHVVVVGFHHKKGCQVEYSYPPLIEGNDVNSSECPEEWKHLPSLALPDGAHNYAEDTVYFHLASRTEEKFTIYCVSCYRQMNSTDLINRGSEVTRNSVQKSVCVLSRLPAYGLIQTKLEMITHAYFKGRDFSQVDLLRDTYITLNMSISEGLLQDPEILHGISCRELLQQFQHRVLILFKLLLLERRILFFSSPVKPVCKTLLTVLSLFPGLIEHGLIQSVCPAKSKPASPALTASQLREGSQEYLDINFETAVAQLPCVTDEGDGVSMQQKNSLADCHNGSADTPMQDSDINHINVDSEMKNNNSIQLSNDSSQDSHSSFDININNINQTSSDKNNIATTSDVSESLNSNDTRDIVKLKRLNRNATVVNDQLVLAEGSGDINLKWRTDGEVQNTDAEKYNSVSQACELEENSCQMGTTVSDFKREASLTTWYTELTQSNDMVSKNEVSKILPSGNSESLLVTSATHSTNQNLDYKEESTNGSNNGVDNKDYTTRSTDDSKTDDKIKAGFITPESSTKSINAEEMEHFNDDLLERDDDIDWEVDNLLLEINEVLDNPDESSYTTATSEQPQSLAGAVGSRISGSLSSLQQTISARTNELWERASLGPRTSVDETMTSITESEETRPQGGVSNFRERIFSGLWGGRVSRSLDDASSASKVADENLRESKEKLPDNPDAVSLVDSENVKKDVMEVAVDSNSNKEEANLETSFSLLGESVHSELSDVIMPFEQDEYGMPLGLFTKGSVCHPYISLHLYDILTDVNIKGLAIGASNALFKQKNLLFDVIVEPLDTRIEINDQELRRQLSLSTADLRFADFLVRTISDEKGDIFLDETGWEGGDDWLRTQFRTYLLSMLAAASHENEKLCDDYNSSFMTAWKSTNNYKLWKRQSHPAMKDITPEHPFHGQLSMSDVKLKFSQVMQSADRNKKINSVVNQTNQVVAQTGKAVGGAITSAKSAVITWFGGFSGSKA